jgi:hypothetical protein
MRDQLLDGWEVVFRVAKIWMLVEDGVVFPDVALNSCVLVDKVKWVLIEPLLYLCFVLAPLSIFFCILAVEKTDAWNIVEPIQPVA